MDLVQQVKSTADIVSVVGQYVRLKKMGGSARYVGLCPFHTEKTPSFSVHSTHQFYKCFGCGQGGDVIKFVMEIERLSFYEALKLLAERSGIPIPKRSEYSDPESKFRAGLYRMHEQAQEVFRANLQGAAGKGGRDYLAGRGLAAGLIDEFGLGYSDPGGTQLVRLFEKDGLGPELLEASGLVLKRTDGSGYIDRFRGRLMFPLHSESGKIIGFAGRALRAGDEPKYMNSPETSIYRKSYVLYNLHRAKESIRKQERAVLVEGYMDVIGVHAAGVREVVASCGTALTQTQVKVLKRHCGRIVVNFDPDSAGTRATERSLEVLLEEDASVRILQLEEGLDPDAYVKQRGADAYRTALERAPGYFSWLAERARRKFDMRTAEGRIAGFEFLLPSIHRIADRLERMTIANEVAEYLGIEPGLVLEEFRKAALQRRESIVRPAEPQLRPVEKLLLKAILFSETALREALPRLAALPASQEFSARRIFEAIRATAAEGKPLAYAEVDARLGDEDRALLASVAFSDELEDEELLATKARECLRYLEESQRDQSRASLKAKIREAERAGNLPEALRLAQELAQLEKSVSTGERRALE